VYGISNPLNIQHLQHRIRRTFNQYHLHLRATFLQDSIKLLLICHINMSNIGTTIGFRECQKTVSSAVNVVAGDNNVPRRDKSDDHIESSHSGRYSKRTTTFVQSRKLRLCRKVSIVQYEGK